MTVEVYNMGTRRANLLYRLRKKGVIGNTKERVIEIPYNKNPYQFVQTKELVKEFNFNVQLVIV